MKTAVVTATQAFAVPDTAGDYAPERLTLFGDPSEGPAIFDGLSVLLGQAVAGDTAELFVLPLGLDPAVDIFWIPAPAVLASVALDTVGFIVPGAVTPWSALQLRVKSGGTSGSATLMAAAW